MYRLTVNRRPDFECRHCDAKYQDDGEWFGTPPFEITFNCHSCGNEISVTRRVETTYTAD